MNTPTFTREDLGGLADAHDLIRRWRTFLLARFADYTHHAEVTPVGGGAALDPIEDISARTNAGYGYYTLAQGWYESMVKDLDSEHAAVNVEHRISDDRGARPSVRTYRLPLTFAFNEATSDNPEYEAFLRLKAQFEPAAREGLDEEERRLAADELRGHARNQDNDPVQILTDPVLADSVYAQALAEANKQVGGGQGDLIRRIHAIAARLGLTQRPANPLSKMRVEAARVLAVQSRSGDDPQPSDEQIKALALPENRDRALLAYDKAITSLHQPHHGGLGDIRRMVYEAASALELDTSSAARAAARERVEAADSTT
jgi:hypothetical protein